MSFDEHALVEISMRIGYSLYAIEWALDQIDGRLEELIDTECEVSNITINLTQNENDRGYVDDHNCRSALKWLCEHHEDASQTWDNIYSKFGCVELHNHDPFDDACGYQTMMFIDIIEELFNECQWFEEHWDEYRKLTAKDIATIKEQVGIIDDDEEETCADAPTNGEEQ